MHTYKLSYYLIFTDPVNEKGDRIVFSTISCRSLLLSALCYNKLQSGAISEIPIPLIEKLIKNGVLVPSSSNELSHIITENNLAIVEDKETLFEVIQPSANCQLGCYYCGQAHTKKTIGKLDADILVRRIENKLIRSNYKKLHIGWFGGEPLMGLTSMRSITQKLLKLCEENNNEYAAKVVTNGLSLKKDIFRELVDCMKVRQIEITLDGTAEFHDIHRYTKAGGSSFSIIFQNLQDAIALKEKENLNCKISIRCNVDKKNEKGVSDLIRYIAEHGLEKKIHFYTTGIYSWGGNDAHKISLSKDEFAKKEIGWKMEMIRHGFTTHFDLPKRKKIVCMVVSPDSEMYDAYGNIFNCTETSYAKAYENSPYELGKLKDEANISKHRPFSDWNDQIQKDESLLCHSCKMLPVCGGACPKSWKEGNPPCPTNKFNLKEKLKLNYKISEMAKMAVY